MIPLPIPLLAKILGPILILATVGVSAYVLGRSHVRAQWEAERNAVKLVAAQAAAVAKERERMWTSASTVAGAKYEAAIKINSTRSNAELQRLRNSASGSGRVPDSASATSSGGSDCGATREELVGFAESLIGLVESATQSDAGLRQCIAAWPR